MQMIRVNCRLAIVPALRLLLTASLSLILVVPRVTAATSEEDVLAARGSLACRALQEAANESPTRLRSLIVSGGFQVNGKRMHDEPMRNARAVFPEIYLVDEETGAWPASVPDLQHEMERFPLAEASVVDIGGEHHVLVHADGKPRWSLWLEHPDLGCNFLRRSREFIAHARPPMELCEALLHGTRLSSSPLVAPTKQDAAVIVAESENHLNPTWISGWYKVDFTNSHRDVTVARLSMEDGHYGVQYDYLALLTSDHRVITNGEDATLLDKLDWGPVVQARRAFVSWQGRTYLDLRATDVRTGDMTHIVRTVRAGQVQTTCEFGFDVKTTPVLQKR